jgi:tetratricopeptide (TPR) repeat protein
MKRRLDWPSAIDYFQHAADHRSNDGFTLGQLAEAYEAAGDHTSAIRVCARGLSLNPEDQYLARLLRALTAPARDSGPAAPPRQAATTAKRSDQWAAGPPRQPLSWSNLVGVAERIDKRMESAGQLINRIHIWNLLVKPVDQQGGTEPSVGVELRGYGIRGGDIEAGEWVEVEIGRSRGRGEGFKTHEVRNLTRGQVIKGKRW